MSVRVIDMDAAGRFHEECRTVLQSCDDETLCGLLRIVPERVDIPFFRILNDRLLDVGMERTAKLCRNYIKFMAYVNKISVGYLEES